MDPSMDPFLTAGKPIQCHNFVLRHVILHFRLLAHNASMTVTVFHVE